MQSRTEVLMMADLVDYSRIMDESPERAINAVRELKTTYLEPVSEEHGGEVLKRMGDGWIFSYPSVSSAVRCAMGVQRTLSSHEVIKLRIGAHLGEIMREHDDFYGPAANIAQRIQAEAPPGGLMVSADVYRQLPGELSAEFHDAGSFKLKNISAPHVLFQWRPDGLDLPHGDDVPSIAVEDFDFAPDDAETRATAGELRDQLLERLGRRTGIRVIDDRSGERRVSSYRLRGRLRLSPTRGRLQMSMVQTDTSTSVWSESFDGDPTDIFEFSDDLVDRADASLRVQINAFDGDRIALLPDDRLSVSELRSRAASLFYRATIEDWEQAVHLMDRAVRLKPDDPMSLAMRVEGVVEIAAARYRELDNDERARLERDMNAAIEASPRSDYCFWTRALLHIKAHRQADIALRDLEHVLELSPAYAPAHASIGLAHMLKGDFVQAAESLGKSLNLSENDTLWPQRAFMHAIAQLCAEDYAAAEATISRAIRMRPSQRAFLRLLAECQRRQGAEKSALATDAAARALPAEPSILALRPPLPEGHAWLEEMFRKDLLAGADQY